MLQNASFMFFLRNKTKKTTTKKEMSHPEGVESETFDA